MRCAHWISCAILLFLGERLGALAKDNVHVSATTALLTQATILFKVVVTRGHNVVGSKCPAHTTHIPTSHSGVFLQDDASLR